MTSYGSTRPSEGRHVGSNGVERLESNWLPSTQIPSLPNRRVPRALGSLMILIPWFALLSVYVARQNHEMESEVSAFKVIEIPLTERNPISNESYFYKFTYPVANGTGMSGFAKLTKFLCAPMSDPVDLGCSGLKVGCEVLIAQQTTADEKYHGFQLHMVDTPKFKTYSKGFTMDEWQLYFQTLNANMSTFNAFQHNKVTLFSSDLPAFQRLLDSEKEPYMGRLTGDTFAHIIIEINGRIFEVVGSSDADLDLSKFEAWHEDECQGAHVPLESVDYYNNQITTIMSDNNDDAISRAEEYEQGTGIAPLLFIGASVATDSLHSNKFDSLISDTTRFSGASWSFKHYTESCVALLGEWPQMPGVTVRYVHNAVAHQGDTSVLTYESAVTKAHSELVSANGWFGWDHWLDQHIGVRNTVYDPPEDKMKCEKLSREITDSLKFTGTPVGERLVMGGSGDKALNQTHIYSGYHGTLAWEYNQQCYQWRHENIPGICACNSVNNDIMYFTETGKQCA